MVLKWTNSSTVRTRAAHMERAFSRSRKLIYVREEGLAEEDFGAAFLELCSRLQDPYP